ncbi:LPS export ABC transporter periplasmic protein LptC [Teredinibacter turnerae]|uniref:LPS export ABC transporter periplasmic protein LptC n=1 Tax=Teredinibacter turnerae TaxID=2426 RepID=UPI000380AC20|nr:LPS export ABC transporter periplasmic protein LptC [Teredinibacter turnerae]
MRKNRFYLLFIAMGIASIVMLWDSSENVITPPKAEPAPQIPYAFAEHAATRYFNYSGVLEYAFTANRLEHFRVLGDNRQPVDEYTMVDHPHFTIYQEDTPWHVESVDGKLVRSSEQIALWDTVRIWQEPPERQPGEEAPAYREASELTTEKLDINPVEKVAYTDEPVKILTPYGVINAVGMTANFKNRKIELHHKVHAIHRIPEDRSLNE